MKLIVAEEFSEISLDWNTVVTLSISPIDKKVDFNPQRNFALIGVLVFELDKNDGFDTTKEYLIEFYDHANSSTFQLF